MILVLLDLALALGMTMRVTRLIQTDHLGRWWIIEPIERHHARAKRRSRSEALWAYIEAGMTCPFCLGFWLGGLVLLSLWLCGGPGDGTWEPWRWVTGWFSLNYIGGHIGSRLDAPED